MSFPLFQLKSLKIHNGNFAVIKVASMYQSWLSGDFLGRWTPAIIQGYGYPSFNYYAPFFFYLSSAISIIVHHLVLGFNLGLFVTLFVSGCTMFLYTKEFWGAEGAFLSAVAYLLIPYHIVDLYIRGATGELVVFALLPLFFWAVYRLSNEPKIAYFLISSLCFAALITAHNVMAMLLVPLIFAYFIFVLIQKRFETRYMVLLGGVFVFAFGIAAYFWLPVLLERGYIQIERDVMGAFSYANHFVYWDQLLYSPWGFEGSVPGRNDFMSFQIGPVHLVLLFLFLIRINCIRQQKLSNQRVVIFWIVVMFFAIFMTLEISNFIWKALPPLAFLQFPWRFLLFVAFTVSFLVGGVCCSLKKYPQLRVALICSVLVFAANISYCRPLTYEDLHIQNPRQFLYESYPMDNMEYLPIDVKALSFTPPENKIEIKSGDGQVLDYKNERDLSYTYKFQANTPVEVFFHSFYFPGWEVFINHQRVEILRDNPFGLISFNIPKGEQLINVVFKSTLVRTVGELISFIFLMGWVVIFIFRKKIDGRSW